MSFDFARAVWVRLDCFGDEVGPQTMDHGPWTSAWSWKSTETDRLGLETFVLDKSRQGNRKQFLPPSLELVLIENDIKELQCHRRN